ncbi:hypothetical protein RI054_24g102030 [Pseudoscourfieldia marina]
MLLKARGTADEGGGAQARFKRALENDVMALSRPPIFEDGEACFLNTKLSLAAHPARVLGASMKDLRKDCPELPEDVSAGGLAPRRGELRPDARRPDVFVPHNRHDGKGFSNLFEYMDASVAMAIPGAVVLAGRLRYRARSEKRRCPPTSSPRHARQS